MGVANGRRFLRGEVAWRVMRLYGEGKSPTEIARKVGVSEGGVRGLIARRVAARSRRKPEADPPPVRVEEWVPSPEEIAAACLEIQAGWSASDRWRAMKGERVGGVFSTMEE